MMYSAQKSDHIRAKSSEVCLLKAGGVPSGGLANQFLLDNVSMSAATHVGLTRGSFLPKSYSFASNTGDLLFICPFRFIIILSHMCQDNIWHILIKKKSEIIKRMFPTM